MGPPYVKRSRSVVLKTKYRYILAPSSLCLWTVSGISGPHGFEQPRREQHK